VVLISSHVLGDKAMAGSADMETLFSDAKVNNTHQTSAPP